MKTTYWKKKIFSCSFYLYRFRKYVSYGFPVINFCNPRVQFETPCIWPWGWLSLQQKWVPRIFPGGLRRLVCRADNFTTCMCQKSWNLVASASWKPQGLSRPVMGLLYIVYFYIIFRILLIQHSACINTGSLLLSYILYSWQCTKTLNLQRSNDRLSYYKMAAWTLA